MQKNTSITRQVPFANFEMPIEQVEENLDQILETLQENKPRRKAESKKVSFLTRTVREDALENINLLSYCKHKLVCHSRYHFKSRSYQFSS